MPGDTSPPRVLVFAGSLRAGSVNRRLAEAAHRALAEAQLDATLVDLRDYPMPLYDGDWDPDAPIPPAVSNFQELVRTHHALAIASPEFNGSFSALVKNTLDWISLPGADGQPLAVFQGKLGAVMSASPGRGGGQRGLRHLRELLEMMGVSVIAPQVAIASAERAFSEAGDLIRAEDSHSMQELVAGLSAALLRLTSALEVG